jgi:hypothetical protein
VASGCQPRSRCCRSSRAVAQEPLAPTEIDAELVTAAWRRAVYANPDLPDGAVNRDAYVAIGC